MMPNGGIDNCGTCAFNRVNGGAVGRHNEGGAFCEIRNKKIRLPLYTYCANHPLHNPDRIEIPIGPVLHGHERSVLFNSPDTPHVRSTLLGLLNMMTEVPRPDCSTTELDEQVVRQLGAFRECQATVGLRRVIAFEPFAAVKDDEWNRSRVWTIAFAIEALAIITGDESLDAIEKLVVAGVNTTAERDRPIGKGLDVIRYYCIEALKHCCSARSQHMLLTATDDPVTEIAEKAARLLRARNRMSQPDHGTNEMDDTIS